MLELPTVSWSEIKTFQRCPKQHEYKYIQRLVPIKKQRPLFVGSWIHACLESYYRDGDWRIGYNLYLIEYNKLFDEEKEELNKRGVLPDIIARIMKSYVFYYKDDGWKTYAVEQKFEVDTKLGKIKGIIDWIVQDLEGLLWVVDHKTASIIPETGAFHAMDPQLMIYPWAAEKAFGLDVAGIQYNYIRSRPPSIPRINNDGSISRRKVLTDYPTMVRFLKANGYDPNDYREILIPLRNRSPFLRRYRLPREAHVTREILLDTLATAKHIAQDKRRSRTITRDCSRMCSYHDLCRAELNGFDTEIMRKSMFTIRSEDGDKPDPYLEPYEDEQDGGGEESSD